MSGVQPWCSHDKQEYLCEKCLKCGACCTCPRDVSSRALPPLIHRNSKKLADRSREMYRAKEEAT